MSDGPTTLQRQAIGNMFQYITNNHPQAWGNWLFDALEDWDLLPNSEISPSQYYSTLANLPAHPKRIIMQIIIMGWNEHHDMQALYDAINTLIYLKVCGPAEYFFLHQVYNFMSYFQSVSNDDKKIFIQMHNLNKYTLRFTSDGHMMGESKALVDLEMSRSSDEPMVVVAPWYYSFDNKMGLPEGTSKSRHTQEFIEEEVLPIICDEFAKRHCHWIYSNCSMSFREDNFGNTPIIFLTNIQYIDNNGI